MAPQPQVIELKRPRFRTEATKNAEDSELEARSHYLISDEDGRFPIGSLNQCEI